MRSRVGISTGCPVSVPPVVALFLAALVASDRLAGDDAVFRREKLRCLSYLDASESGVRAVPRVRSMGFNCGLTMLAGGPAARLQPLISAADAVGLPLLLVDYCDTKRYFAERQGAPPRRFIAGDGRVSPHLACPADPDYWESVLGRRALELARLRRAGHRSAGGLLLDIEDYAGSGDLACGGLLDCYCDECFGAFQRLLGKVGDAVPTRERRAWLTSQGLDARYRASQDEAVIKVLAALRRRVDAAAPEFALAVYPWPYLEPQDRGSRVAWDRRLVRGLGTAAAPLLLFSENTYAWGYDPAMERQRAELAEPGLHFRAIAGFNLVPAERAWWPEEMATSGYWAARRADGFRIYVGDWVLLQAAAGRDLAGVWGDTPARWVREFSTLNRRLATGRPTPMPLLPLAPLKDCFQLSDLYNPKHSPRTPLLVRRWSDCDTPWLGGELVVRGTKPGDWLSFQRPVRRADRYEISAWLTTGPNRPIVRLFVDEQPVGETHDLYERVLAPGDRSVLAHADLTSGDHVFRIVAEGKHPRSSGYEIGLRAASLVRIGYSPGVWSVIGPFDNTGDSLPGYEAVFPPEQAIELAAAYSGKGGEPVRWRQASAALDGYLDLLPLFSERKEAVAYCLTYVYSPADGLRTLLLGSDDGGKLFVNGQIVWGEARTRSAVRDQNAPRAMLHRGWNVVLFKVLQATGGWGIYFRVEDPNRELRYAPAPPS